MATPDPYTPTAAFGAEVEKKGERWTLAMVRTLKHPPTRVWEALTDPAQLREWAPFDADAKMNAAGATVTLTTVNAPNTQVAETRITRADAGKRLEYNWGGHDLRWELEAIPEGTRLTLWTTIPRNFIAMGAAGWHICFDVLGRLLDGAPIGRRVGMPLMSDPGWNRLHAEYAKEFGVEMPKW